MRIRLVRPSRAVFWLCLLFIGVPVSGGLIWLWVHLTGTLPRRAPGGAFLAIGLVVSWAASVAIHIWRLHRRPE